MKKLNMVIYTNQFDTSKFLNALIISIVNIACSIGLCLPFSVLVWFTVQNLIIDNTNSIKVEDIGLQLIFMLLFIALIFVFAICFFFVGITILYTHCAELVNLVILRKPLLTITENVITYYATELTKYVTYNLKDIKRFKQEVRENPRGGHVKESLIYPIFKKDKSEGERLRTDLAGCSDVYNEILKILNDICCPPKRKSHITTKKVVR